jgi:hypothetical protein
MSTFLRLFSEESACRRKRTLYPARELSGKESRHEEGLFLHTYSIEREGLKKPFPADIIKTDKESK